jgi:hypothetical protein
MNSGAFSFDFAECLLRGHLTECRVAPASIEP